MKKETTEAQTVEATAPHKDEKKIQISIKMLKELTADGILRTHFINTIEENVDMKAPIAYQFAKALTRQKELAL